MADKPIIFSAPMIRALLDGRKTQTRRVLKPQPAKTLLGGWIFEHSRKPFFCGHREIHHRLALTLPIEIGDRLWVRETFQTGIWRGQDTQVTYRATMDWPWDGPWRSPIFMPRKLSRLTLTVTDVRVQRVQEISEADAKAEGLATVTKDGNLWKWGIADSDGLPGNDDHGWHWQEWEVDPRAAFKRLWNSIHGPDAWGANPWVVALTFDVHHCNIDQLAEATP